MSSFKIAPKVIDRLEFKNGIGKVMASVVKTDDEKVTFIGKINHVVLSEKEQLELMNFLAENL